MTDEQRALVIGRLYQTVKLAQGRPSKDGKEAKFASFSGSNATAKGLASSIGIGERTVRYAAKFTEALEALEQVSPQAAERVLRGEVKDAGDSVVAYGAMPKALAVLRSFATARRKS